MRAGSIIFALVIVFPAILSGQDNDSASASHVIVGLLTGAQDARELTINTTQGAYPVASVGNSRPFHITQDNKHYISLSFDKGTTASSTPSFVEYRYFTSERLLVTAIILDEIDYAILQSESPTREVARASRNYRILHLNPAPNTVELIVYNLSHRLLSDRNIRYALSHGIDKKKIKRDILFEKADLAKGPYAKESKLYTTVKELKYDPKKAIDHLESSGWQKRSKDRVRYSANTPLRFRLFFPEGLNHAEKIVRQIKIDCIQIGIDIIAVPLSAAAINDSLDAGNFDAVLLRQQFPDGGQFPDWGNSLAGFFGDGSGGGMLKYSSKEFNHTYRLSEKLEKEDEKRTAIKRLQVILNEDQPATFLYHPWVEFHLINVAKFESYLDENGAPRPFETWKIRQRD